MSPWPTPHHWRAEALRLRRQPLAWIALGTLLAVLLAAAVVAGLDARAWREDAARQDQQLSRQRAAAIAQFRDGPPAGAGAALATYQLGRGELGATRMTMLPGLALGLHRLETMPTRLRVSLDSRHADARDPGPLRNPLLTDTGLPGLPAIVALVLPLVALVLCAGLLQDEREQGRLGLLRVQSRRGLFPVLAAALGWRLGALCVVVAVGTLPALALDPGASLTVALQWLVALVAFCAVWVGIGGLLSCAPVSGATAMLAALGSWLLSTFAVPAALMWAAEREAPMPSRLAAIVDLRAAQQDGEVREAALAQAWYAAHPDIPPRLPAVWPASFVPRVLAQDDRLRPLMRRFDDSRQRQAASMARWAWLSPGLKLVLVGERLAGTDTARHVAYLREVDAFEDRWRDLLVPRVMDGRGADAQALAALPRFEMKR
ncbi:hypothetical protein CDN99_21455 [Roseateles aquatilis]|uniref:Uncharacterized protein n=1 Tax=Roseateles aquatilis TaxID=431061 RepID=A0A246J0E0_9BURK|nr:DUF3526 domain-containing protein [Roseateles aquatilis]OWQ85654.1 hypothetical protein CDN99_21455 [Roseateles aquatilis]